MTDFKLNNFDKISEALNKEKSDTLNYVKASVVFFPDDLEFYKDFLYHMKITTGNPRFTHKEAMEEVVKLLKKKFPNVKPRPDAEREREKELGRPKK